MDSDQQKRAAARWLRQEACALDYGPCVNGEEGKEEEEEEEPDEEEEEEEGEGGTENEVDE